MPALIDVLNEPSRMSLEASSASPRYLASSEGSIGGGSIPVGERALGWIDQKVRRPRARDAAKTVEEYRCSRAGDNKGRTPCHRPSGRTWLA